MYETTVPSGAYREDEKYWLLGEELCEPTISQFVTDEIPFPLIEIPVITSADPLYINNVKFDVAAVLGDAVTPPHRAMQIRFQPERS